MDKKEQEKLLTEIMDADAKNGLYDHIGYTNKMVTMKLYTKEMFLHAAEKCEVSMIDAEHIMKFIDEYVTPIELPSDEEIEYNAKDYANFIGNKNGTAIFDYIKGAYWMRDKILNK